MILVIDSNPDAALRSVNLLHELGYRSKAVNGPSEASRMLHVSGGDVDMVVLDLEPSPDDSFELIKRIKSARPEIGVVVAAIIEDVESIVLAIKCGAHNYVLKPLRKDSLSKVLRLYKTRLAMPLAAVESQNLLVAEDTHYIELIRRAEVPAKTKLPVLIVGESGTGKSLLARMVHGFSEAHTVDSVELDLLSLPSETIDAKILGVAASDSSSESGRGCFARADRSSLILHELPLLSLDQQTRILRVLRDGTYVPLGSQSEMITSSRLIATATLKKRDHLLEGGILPELYHALSSQLLCLTPLRDRVSEIEPLAYHFLRRYALQYRKSVQSISKEALKHLRHYHFPANVRELESIVNSAVLLAATGEITAGDLPRHVSGVPHPLEDELEAVRYRTVMRVLAECDGNQTEAAKKLGIARGSLNRILRGYRQNKPSSGDDA